MKILVVGESGLGKTTFIRNMFAPYAGSPDFPVKDASGPDARQVRGCWLLLIALNSSCASCCKLGWPRAICTASGGLVATPYMHACHLTVSLADAPPGKRDSHGLRPSRVPPFTVWHKPATPFGPRCGINPCS